MFETLEQQIESTEGTQLTTKLKLLRYAALFVITTIVFGAMYLAVRVLA